jgi:hypothetical protein
MRQPYGSPHFRQQQVTVSLPRVTGAAHRIIFSTKSGFLPFKHRFALDDTGDK